MYSWNTWETWTCPQLSEFSKQIAVRSDSGMMPESDTDCLGVKVFQD